MVVDPITGWPFRVCKLRSLELPDNHKAQVDKPLDYLCAFFFYWIELGVRARRSSCLEPFQVYNVFYGYAQARVRLLS